MPSRPRTGRSSTVRLIHLPRDPADSDLWSPAPTGLTDPADLFSDGVYVRGGMTIEALRQEVGWKNLSTILRRWAATQEVFGGQHGRLHRPV